MDFLAFARGVLERQRAAILTGQRYRGPGLFDASDPAWHEIERLDDAELIKMNGDPSHYTTCAACAELRRQQQKDARCEPCAALPF